MYEKRIKHLEDSHQILNKQIDGMEKTGKFDDSQLANLKKQRLHFRDEIAILKKKQWEHDHETIDFDDER